MSAFLWAVITACIWGVVPILEKLGLAKTEPFVALFYRCLGVILGILVLGIFVLKPEQIKAVPPRSIALFVVAGFLASFAAQITFYHALKIGDVSRVVPISGAYPLIAFLLGILVLGESVTLMKVLGVILIIGGAWLLK